MAPRWPQDGPKTASRWPKMAPRWLQNGILADLSALRKHLGATCWQHGGQDGNLQATWPNLGRTGAVLEGSGAVLEGSGAVLGALEPVKLSVKGVKDAVHGTDLRIARALWKTKSSKKRSLQKSKVI